MIIILFYVRQKALLNNNKRLLSPIVKTIKSQMGVLSEIKKSIFVFALTIVSTMVWHKLIGMKRKISKMGRNGNKKCLREN